MRIIEEKPFEFEYTCQGCGSKLVAEADDIKYARDTYEGSTYYVRCPVCGTIREIPFERITPVVRQAAEQRDER